MTFPPRVAGFALLLLAGCGGGAREAPYLSPVEEARLAALRDGGLVLAGDGGFALVSVELAEPVPHDPEGRPVLNGAPAHLVARVAMEASVDTVTVQVYEVASYQRHFVGGARAGFERRLDALRAAIEAGPGSVGGEVPVFPQPREAQRFRALVRAVTFDGGTGLAFITQFSDDASPPASDELAWVFQGLSANGAWLLSVVHPLRVSGLPASEDPRRVAAAVDTLPAAAFAPDPARLAELAAALGITSPPSVTRDLP